MNIHEYQAKAVLKEFGVPVSEGAIVFSPAEAKEVAQNFGPGLYVVKSQIHAGGRGAGKFAHNPEGKGGVRLTTSPDEVETFAADMLGKTLITKQTGPQGKEVNRVYVELGCDISKELYFSMLLDRESASVSVIASTEGGMDIEDVAETHPEKIFKMSINPVSGFMPHHARSLAFALGLEGDLLKQGVKFFNSVYQAFVAKDCDMLEINPLVITPENKLLALDAKVAFDDNALYRHPEIEALRDEDEEDPAEIEAKQYDLNFIKLDGTIGCMVNGAGLAMATMDTIKLYGEEPANFLDVGGSATREKVTAAFKIILKDPGVKGVLVNIFGGIMRCDIIANGIIEAAKSVDLSVPLVVRLAGTNVEQGVELLEQSGLPIIAADNLAEGAEKVVNAIKGQKG